MSASDQTICAARASQSLKMVSANALSYLSLLLPTKSSMPRLGQSLAVADRHVLRPPVAVVDQGIGTFGLAVVQDLLRCIEYEVYSHGAVLPPARGPASINVEHVGHA